MGCLAGFIADVLTTNGRAYATMLCPSVCRLYYCDVCTFVNGASESISYCWQPIRSRICGIVWYQNEWPWPLLRGRLMLSTVASHSPLNISELLEIEAWFQRTTNRKWPMGNRTVMWLMTLRDHERSSMLRAQYLKNSWRCYLETVTNYQIVCCEAVLSAILATAWLLVWYIAPDWHCKLWRFYIWALGACERSRVWATHSLLYFSDPHSTPCSVLNFGTSPLTVSHRRHPRHTRSAHALWKHWLWTDL